MAILLLFGSFDVVNAETWKLLDTDAHAQHFVDQTSVISAVKAVEYWDKMVFAKQQPFGSNRPIKEIRTLSVANCQTRKIASMLYAIYGEGGLLIDVQTSSLNFQPTGSGTKAEIILNYVCSVKPNPGMLAKRKGGAAAILAELNDHPDYKLPPAGRQARYASLIRQEAEANHVEPALVKAVIAAESDFNPYAVSPKGAIGLMQLLPLTAKRFGVTKLFDPEQNIRAGVKYLSYLLGLFNNDIKLAIAAYNAGERSIIKYGKQVPPYKETLNYVPRVIHYYNSYK